jgi:hypothetical protein
MGNQETFYKLLLPLANLYWMYIIYICNVSQSLVPNEGLQGNLSLELRRMISTL